MYLRTLLNSASIASVEIVLKYLVLNFLTNVPMMGNAEEVLLIAQVQEYVHLAILSAQTTLVFEEWTSSTTAISSKIVPGL